FFGGKNVATNSGLSESFWLGVGGCRYDGYFSLDLVEGLHLAHTRGRVGGAEKRKPGDCHCHGCRNYWVCDCGRVDGGAAADCFVYSLAWLTLQQYYFFSSRLSRWRTSLNWRCMAIICSRMLRATSAPSRLTPISSMSRWATRT